MRSIYEKRAHEELVKDGYSVDFKIRPRICPRGYTVDYFHAFDLIACKKDAPTRWISIKGTMGILNSHRRLLESVPLSSGNIKEVWCVNDSGVWRKEVVH